MSRWQDFSDRFSRIKDTDIIMFNEQLATMLGSGLTLLDGLRALKEQVGNERLVRIIEDLSRSIKEGSTFSMALSKHPRDFSEFYVNMVLSGETAGNLEEIMMRLADFKEQALDIQEKIKTAMIYPVILVVFALLLIIFLVAFVLPAFISMFTKMGVPLPLPTRILCKMSDIIRHFWHFLLGGIMLLMVGFKRYTGKGRGRSQWHRFKLNLPVLGTLIRRIIMLRMAQTWAMLLKSGVPMLRALEVVEKTVDNVTISRVIRKTQDEIREGGTLAKALQRSKEFPPDVIKMIAIGEESGNLERMLERLAQFYDRMTGYSIKRLTALLEPIFLIVLGGGVGFIISSILLPIFRMIKIVQR